MFGLNRLKTISAAAVVVAAGWTGAASAATVSATCPDSGVWDRYFTVSSDDPNVTSIDCYYWGDDNDANDDDFQDQLAADGYEFLGKIEDPNGEEGDTDLLQDMVDLLGGTDGEFDLTEEVEVVLVFKVGKGQCKDDTVSGNACVPAYAAFEITTTGAALLAWETSMQQGLSHVTIYAKPVAPVPVPAAGLLLIGALGALGLARRRRRAA